MKKLAFVLLVIVLIGTLFGLCSCNKKLLDFEYDQYTHIHYIPTNKDIKIKKWTDMEVGIKVEFMDGSIAYFSEGTYILFKGTCPVHEE